jgi:hypothetical protein
VLPLYVVSLMVVAYHLRQSYEKAKAMLLRPKRC